MTIYFPQINAALTVRKHAPEGAQFVMRLGAQSEYLVPTNEAPPEAEIAKGPLGGWNFPNGWAVSLVYGSTIRALYEYRRQRCGKWVVLPQRLGTNKCVGLILEETGVPVSMGCTPVIAEQALSETE
jgi:hypothetical protein